jgi:hypothetical protein
MTEEIAATSRAVTRLARQVVMSFTWSSVPAGTWNGPFLDLTGGDAGYETG